MSRDAQRCLPNQGHLYPQDRYLENKYLYLDSEARDPAVYPNPAEFSVSVKDTDFQSYRTVHNTLHVAVSLVRLVIPESVIPLGTKELFVHIGSQNDKNTKLVVTNNRNVNDAVFVVPVNDTAVNGSLYLRNTDMTQRLRLKLDDYINFRISTRDGVTLPITDTVPDPDPDVQLTMMFELAPESISVN